LCSSNAQRPTNLSAESRHKEVALKLTVVQQQMIYELSHGIGMMDLCQRTLANTPLYA
jgi:hypothetical protein